MVNQQLLDYIKQQVQQEIPSDVIKKTLITSGWQETDINEVFSTLNLTQQVAQLPIQPTIPEVLQPVVPHKKNWVKRTTNSLIRLAILYLIFLYLPAVLNLFTKDIPPLEYSDIQLPKVNIPDNDNAYFDIEKIKSVIYYPKESSDKIAKMALGGNWDEQFSAELISKNSETFIYLTQVDSKSKFQNPHFSNPSNISFNLFNSETLPLSLYLNLARLKSIHSLYFLSNNDKESAIKEAFSILSFGQKLEDSQGPFLSYLTAIAIKTIGLTSLQIIVSNSTSTTEDLIKYSNDLNKYSQDKEGFTRSLKVENYIEFSDIDSANSRDSTTYIPFNKIRADYMFKVDKTKQIIIDRTRTRITALDSLCTQTNKPVSQTDDKLDAFKDFIPMWFIENIVGKLLIRATDNIKGDIFCKTSKLPIGATQLILSLKAFKNDNRTLPNDLNELVPKYLSSVPLDPYDGKPLRYSKEKKIIYSVGISTEDVGGSIGDSWQTMKNPTFKFDF